MKRIVSDLFVMLSIISAFFIGFYCCQINTKKQEKKKDIVNDDSMTYEIKDSKFRNLEQSIKPHEIIESDWPENQKPFLK